MHGFACVFLPHFLQITPRPTRRERVSATALKPPCKAGGRGGESTARMYAGNNLTLQPEKETELESFLFLHGCVQFLFMNEILFSSDSFTFFTVFFNSIMAPRRKEIESSFR
ncbi:hypothetical protein E2923_24170 [Salmonella enterica subsp. enterica serovar Typhimurium]|nr:hypothetical protein [Salmonella enterica subsp. enterica serovar Typhimurium]HAG8970543.1 hypothetical protein [Escherichia coli]EDF6697282.1 hypothetical protein [Salmonella enterica subsp. enterica serovar Typhimurium]EDG6665761.1 hypothetical protein [Salmonella enterica subsp. enterica serovar Typhimurium]EDI3955493.1 hypothetical protein [Salmonella enterica subsp. enterica serovar Typhimurium]